VSTWFETIAAETVYDGRSTVRIETVRTPDGRDVLREIVDHDDAVAIVPVTDDGAVVLLRQYRQAVRGYLLEIPAGTLDVDGESVEEAARRELIEEIGHDVGELTHLVTFLNSAGWTTERTHVYLGTQLSTADAPDGFEAKAEEADMEVVRIPVADAVAEARAGKVTDAKTCIGLLMAGHRLGL
jgi:8-oxo-dGDP phosphatase